MAQYTKYPQGIDTSTELPKATDLVTAVNGEAVNRLREAILAIENELGIQPSGTRSTVRARLDYLETTIAGYGILKLSPFLTTNNTPDTFPMVEISTQPTRQEIQIFAKDPNSLDIASWFFAINMELRLSTNTVFLGGNRLNVAPDESDASMSGLEVSITGATGAAGFFIEVTGLPSDDVSWQVMVVQVTP